MITRQQFYKSKQWESFRRVIVNERTNEDGFVVRTATLKAVDGVIEWAVENRMLSMTAPTPEP